MSEAGRKSKAGNAAPSSSGRQRASAANSREVLLSSSGGGFLGFEAFRPSSANRDDVPEDAEEDALRVSVYTGSHEFFSTVFRTLTTKTDTTTVLRAGNDFLARLASEEAVPASELRQSLPHFGFVFSRLARDSRHRVRHVASKILLGYTQRIPLALQAKGMRIFGSDWLCLLRDPVCRDAIRESLERVNLSSDGNLAVSTGTLRQLVRFVRQRPEDALSWTSKAAQDDETSAEDAAIRVRTHALEALAVALPSNSMETLASLELFTPSTWKLVLLHESFLVRRAAYALLASAARVSATLSIGSPEMAKLLARIPQEKERSATTGMWEGLLSALQFHKTFFEGMDVRKAFLPHVWGHFERGFNGATAAAGSALPLLSLLPAELVSSEEFPREWITRLLAGSQVAGNDRVHLACFESLLYCSRRPAPVALGGLHALVLSSMLSAKRGTLPESGNEVYDVMLRTAEPSELLEELTRALTASDVVVSAPRFLARLLRASRLPNSRTADEDARERSKSQNDALGAAAHDALMRALRSERPDVAACEELLEATTLMGDAWVARGSRELLRTCVESGLARTPQGLRLFLRLWRDLASEDEESLGECVATSMTTREDVRAVIDALNQSGVTPSLVPKTFDALNEVIRSRSWYAGSDAALFAPWMTSENAREGRRRALRRLRVEIAERSGISSRALGAEEEEVEEDELMDPASASAWFSLTESDWPALASLVLYLYERVESSSRARDVPIEHLARVERWLLDGLESSTDAKIDSEMWLRVLEDVLSCSTESEATWSSAKIQRYDLLLRFVSGEKNLSTTRLSRFFGEESVSETPRVMAWIHAYCGSGLGGDVAVLEDVFDSVEESARVEFVLTETLRRETRLETTEWTETLKRALAAAWPGARALSSGFVETLLGLSIASTTKRVVWSGLSASLLASPELRERFRGLIATRVARVDEAMREELGWGPVETSLETTTKAAPVVSPSRTATPESSLVREWSAGDAVCYATKSGESCCAEVLSRHPHPDGELYYTVSAWEGLLSVDRPTSEAREIQTLPERLTPRRLADEERARVAVSKLLIAARAKSDRRALVQLMALQTKLTTISPVQAVPVPTRTTPDPNDETEEDSAPKTQRAWVRVAFSERLTRALSELAELAALVEPRSPGVSELLARLARRDAVPRDASVLSDVLALTDAMSGSEALDAAYVSAVCSEGIRSACADANVSLLTHVLASRFAASTGRLEPTATRALRRWTLGFDMEDERLTEEWAQLACYVLLSFSEDEEEEEPEEAEEEEKWIEVISNYAALPEPTEAASALHQVHKLRSVVALDGLTRRYGGRPVVPPATSLGEDAEEAEYAARGAELFPASLLGAFHEALETAERDTRSGSAPTRPKWTAYMLWSLLVSRAARATQDVPAAREWLGAWIRASSPRGRLGDRALSILCESEDLTTTSGTSSTSLVFDAQLARASSFARALTRSRRDFDVLTRRVWYVTTSTFPRAVREWYVDRTWRDRSEKAAVFEYVAKHLSPMVLREDLLELARQVRERALPEDKFRVKASLTSRVVAMTVVHDETSFETELRFPEGYPLVQPVIECTKRVGVRPDKWQKWSLQIIQLLAQREGTLAEAVFQWKRNLDAEYEGVEPCPICYAVAHASDGAVPKSKCKTCSNVFHSKCLGKWWASTHQSLCPLCKTSFMV